MIAQLAKHPLKLRAAIFPVFEVDGEHVDRFLGTCFALHGKPTVIISAAHVFDEVQSERVCLLLRDVNDKVFPMVGSEWTVNRENDLAFVNIANMPPNIVALPLAESMVGATDSVFSFEFSPTVTRLHENRRKFTPNTYSHVGNIVTHEYAKSGNGTDYSRRFETSYPALRGASGAPVMAVSNSAVLGVLIGNHSLLLAEEGTMNFGVAVSLAVLKRVLADNRMVPTLKGI